MNDGLEQEDLAHIWANLSDCLEELSTAKLFITGGTGFFGRWILESLFYAKQHYHFETEIVVLTRDKNAFEKSAPHLATMPKLSFIEGDIRSFDFSDQHVTFTHIIHAATEASAKLNQEDPLCMLETNVFGTEHLLKFAVKTGARKLLLTSSGAVYGKQPSDLSHITETFHGAPDPLLADSAYGIGKMASEHLCILYAKKYNLEVKIARCFAFVGPFLPLDSHFAIGNFIHSVIKKEPILIKGDGSPFRSYLYAADLIIWLWKILCHGRSGEAYNVGSEEAIDIKSLANLVANKSKHPINVNVVSALDPSKKPARYVPCTKKAKDELNLQQWISLSSAIDKTIRWGEKVYENKSN